MLRLVGIARSYSTWSVSGLADANGLSGLGRKGADIDLARNDDALAGSLNFLLYTSALTMYILCSPDMSCLSVLYVTSEGGAGSDGLARWQRIIWAWTGWRVVLACSKDMRSSLTSKERVGGHPYCLSALHTSSAEAVCLDRI